MAKKIKKQKKVFSKEAPFEEVKLVSFSFSTKDKDETAYLQYKLLLNPEILQAHLDFATQKATAIGLPHVDFENVLSSYGLKHKFLLVEWLSYKEYKTRNSGCSI
jgi:hypothetical protein